MSSTRLSTADVLAQRLYAAGIRHAFGMPGGEVLTLVDALGRAGIEFVLVRHENAGGFMAEGVHHATGAPGLPRGAGSCTWFSDCWVAVSSGCWL